MPRPGRTGARAVLDLIVLRNDGRASPRECPTRRTPSWTVALPPGTGGMQVGESDLSPDAVVRDGRHGQGAGAARPGQKQLSLEYAVTAADGTGSTFGVGSGGRPLNVLVEEPDARVSGGALALADSQVIEGRTFRRWTGRVPAGGDRHGDVRRRGGRASGGARWPRSCAGRGRARARRVAAAPAPGRGRREPRRRATRLLDAIAALDARYAGRESETASEEWAAYETERAALKARLEHALASGYGAPVRLTPLDN